MRFNLLALLLLLTSQASWATVNIESWQTKQGTQVLFVYTPSLPMVDIRIAFDAGSARDTDKFGISALTMAIVNTSAGAWNADQVSNRFESVGAVFGTGVSEDMAWLSLRSLTEKPLLDSALTTFHTVLTQPSFSAKDFQREKKLTLATLKHQEESPAAIASIAFQKALYHDHPYAHPESGSLQTVNSLSIKDLKTFYQKYYVATAK